MDAFINNEIAEITKSLKDDNFFNLSGIPVPNNVKAKLNLGRQYCPFYKPVNRKEMISFYQEAGSLIEGYFNSMHVLPLTLDRTNLYSKY